MTVVHIRDAPYRHWVIDGLLPVAAQLATAEAAASLARRDGCWLPYDNCLQSKVLADDPARIGPDTASLCELLAGRLQVEWFREHLGVSIPGLVPSPDGHGGAVHAMLPGDHLGCHVDRELHPRAAPPLELRLVLVMFLVPQWSPAWGGALELYDDSGPELVPAVSVLPLPGRAVVWERVSGAYHGVQRVSDDCPVPRVTATSFYYAPARPGARCRRALFVSPKG